MVAAYVLRELAIIVSARDRSRRKCLFSTSYGIQPIINKRSQFFLTQTKGSLDDIILSFYPGTQSHRGCRILRVDV